MNMSIFCRNIFSSNYDIEECDRNNLKEEINRMFTQAEEYIKGSSNNHRDTFRMHFLHLIRKCWEIFFNPDYPSNSGILRHCNLDCFLKNLLGRSTEEYNYRVAKVANMLTSTLFPEKIFHLVGEDSVINRYSSKQKPAIICKH